MKEEELGIFYNSWFKILSNENMDLFRKLIETVLEIAEVIKKLIQEERKREKNNNLGY